MVHVAQDRLAGEGTPLILAQVFYELGATAGRGTLLPKLPDEYAAISRTPTMSRIKRN